MKRVYKLSRADLYDAVTRWIISKDETLKGTIKADVTINYDYKEVIDVEVAVEMS